VENSGKIIEKSEAVCGLFIFPEWGIRNYLGIPSPGDILESSAYKKIED
jgi:hypothetical protein